MVIINSPTNGDEITVGEDVLVSAMATDVGGVTRVQLFANSELVKTTLSESPDGDPNLQVVLDYTTRDVGNLELEVIAYRGSVASDPVAVTVDVLEEEEEIQVPIDNSGPVIDPNDPTCRILPNVNLNYRTGPGVVYDRLGTLVAGTQVPIVGRVGDNSWWQIQINSFTRAWVSSDFTSEYGICTNIPVVVAPPTPTSTAATATPTRTSTPTPTLTPTITNTPLPADLVVTSITGPTALVLDGGSASGQYTVQITNTGNAPTGQFDNTIIYLPGGSSQALGVVGNLNGGESIVLNTTLTFNAAGEFTVQASADSDDNVDEQSEVNNLGTYVVSVTSP